MLASSSRHVLKARNIGIPSASSRNVAQVTAVSRSRPQSPHSRRDSSPQDRRDGRQFLARQNPMRGPNSARMVQLHLDTELAQWNSKIGNMADSRKALRAFEIAREMKEAGVKPNDRTYDHLLQACGGLGASVEAWAVLEDMLAMGIKPTRTTFHRMLNAVRLKPVDETYKVLDLMKAHRIRPDSLVYELVIQRLAHAESLELALQWLADMSIHNLSPSLKAMTTIIKLACDLSQSRLAIDLAVSFEQSSPRTLDAQTWYSCLVAAADSLYAEGVVYAWERTINVLKQAPDEGLCIAVLHTAGRHGLTDLALDAIRALGNINVEWQEYHFAPVIEASCKTGDIKEAFGTLSLMRTHGVNPLLDTALPIFQIIATDADKIDEAWGMLEDMRKAGAEVDVVAFNTLIRACAAIGDLQRALGTYQAAADLGVTPNLDTYNTLLSACIAAEHRELGDRLLTQLREAAIKPDVQTYERMIILCLTQASYEDAFYYLEEMKTVKLKPTQSIYEAIIRKCVSMGDRRHQLAVAEMEESGFVVSQALAKYMENELQGPNRRESRSRE